MRGAKRAQYYANAQYVRNRRRQALAARLLFSTELGAANRLPGGGGASYTIVPPDKVVIDNGAAYTAIPSDTGNLVVHGSVMGRFGNNSIFGARFVSSRAKSAT